MEGVEAYNPEEKNILSEVRNILQQIIAVVF